MSLLVTISRRRTSNLYAMSASESNGRSQYPDRSVVDKSNRANPNRRRDDQFEGQSDETSDEHECEPGRELPVIQNCTCGIVADVKNRWESSGYASLTTIECACVDGVLVIRGTVSSYYYKQLAQECVRGVRGIQRIVNELTVPQWNERRTNLQDDVDPNE